MLNAYVANVAAKFPVVVSAGNDNADACNTSPASARAMSGGVITVGASYYQSVAGFSNQGGCVTVFAPGQGIASQDGNGTLYPTTTDDSSGTSFAAPFVTGIAAMVVESYPDLLPSDVMAAIRDNATAGALTQNLWSSSPNRFAFSRIYSTCNSGTTFCPATSTRPQRCSYLPNEISDCGVCGRECDANAGEYCSGGSCIRPPRCPVGYRDCCYDGVCRRSCSGVGCQ